MTADAVLTDAEDALSALGELTDETAPAVVFAPHRDAAKGGVLHNPQEVSHEA